jgi:hypothetical protein
MYANIFTQVQVSTLPQLPGRVNCTWENSREEYLYEGWRRITGRTAIPDGATITGTRYEQDTADITACISVYTYKTLDQVAAERKAAMSAKLTPGIVGLAMAYRMTLRAMFPKANPDDAKEPYAEVNRQVTQDVVVGTLMQLPPEQYDAKTADMLKLAFEQLSAIAGDGTTWTFFETVGDLIPMGGA